MSWLPFLCDTFGLRLRRPLATVCRGLALSGLLACGTATAAPPDINALISYTTLEVSPDGITQQHSYKERWIRTADTVWSERLIPLPVARAFHQIHDASKVPHKHFLYQMAARWVTLQPDQSLKLVYVDHYHKNQIYYPPIEYGQAGFNPDWTLISQLFNPALLNEFTQTDDEAPEGAHWYQHEQGNTIMRVLWSDTLQLALALDRHTRDGYKQYRMDVKLKSPVASDHLPWLKLQEYDSKEISDFFD
jgi:hypothetical protein